ncbi:hypothetical protein [Clostridium botulinum]|uniref:hypothetical protein n=1 Tax=Clostridium botulinum TaxID=1491 RepID=UPI0019675A0D|nr:hypothetical protein [Clostridium botulinum]MBN1079298.1 hypothetical protein [Clostridium botulinum]
MFNNKKKNNDIEIKNKSFEQAVSIFILYIIGIGAFVAIAFRISSYGHELKISDYFNFVGSFGGAILGAIVSFLILYITVIRERNALEQQRKRFEKEYNIKIINDKLNLYKEMYRIVVVIRYNITFIITELRDNFNNNEVEEAYNTAWDMLKEFRFHSIVNIDKNFCDEYKDLRKLPHCFEYAINDYSHGKINIQDCKEQLTLCVNLLIKMERLITDKAAELTEQKYYN